MKRAKSAEYSLQMCALRDFLFLSLRDLGEIWILKRRPLKRDKSTTSLFTRNGSFVLNFKFTKLF